MKKMTLEDLEMNGKRVLMRVDFNVPLEDGRVADEKRIRSAIPSIEYIMRNSGRLILMSHLGRPKGKRVPEMSLAPCVPVLKRLLRKEVTFVDACVGPKAEAAVEALGPGEVLLLENLRFHKEETDNDDDFSKKIAALGDIYVNDAFGTAHRAHASTVGVTRHIQPSAAGFLLTREMDYLGKVVESPERPFVAILGGAKISGKIDVIANLLPKVDKLVVGGGMAFTFLKAKGLEIGKSLLEADKVALAETLLEKGGEKIILPLDYRVSDTFDFANRKVGALQTVTAESIPSDCLGLDIGPRSVSMLEELLSNARTIVWNGPMGVFEIDATAEGTVAVAGMLAQVTRKGATTVIGGGDSASAVRKAGVEKEVSHVSTGGGASLEFLEGKVLPGMAALTDRR